jgi:transcriptional regulator with XRE-family HTH domain
VVLALWEHRRILGEAIRAARKEVGFSQEKLAEKADLSTVFISRIERRVKPEKGATERCVCGGEPSR